MLDIIDKLVPQDEETEAVRINIEDTERFRQWVIKVIKECAEYYENHQQRIMDATEGKIRRELELISQIRAL